MVRKKEQGKQIISSVSGERYRAFVPNPLPPDPPLLFSNNDLDLIEKANRALGRLDGITAILPDTAIFIYFYVRKEALVSSQIEGTQSSLSDLLLFESEKAPGVPLEDVQEVSNYISSMTYGIDRLNKGFPISIRLIRETHKIMLSKGRGSEKNPGEFRRTQNWIGGTRPGNAVFVPPPPEYVLESMGSLEKFIHDDTKQIPVLIKTALAHAQFETIHPFLDGNGRLGRLLITLLLCSFEVLQEPLLYLSLFFKTNRTKYYDLLQNVRRTGDWEGWIRFFLTGVFETSQQVLETSKTLLTLFEENNTRIENIGRASGSALRVHTLLQKKPIISIPELVNELKLSTPTVTASIKYLQKLGIVRELTGRPRNRLFVYSQFIDILNEGTEPLR